MSGEGFLARRLRQRKREAGLVDLATEALAAYRLGRLMGRDTITEPIRAWVSNQAYGGRTVRRGYAWFEDMLACPWCRTVWAAAIITTLRGVPAARPAVRGLAIAGAAALIATHLDKEAT